MHLQENLFQQIICVPQTLTTPLPNYYQQTFFDFIFVLGKLNLFRKKVRVIDTVIAANEYISFLASFLIFPFTKKVFFVHGLRNSHEKTLRTFSFHLFIAMFLERFAWFVSQHLVIPSERAKKTVKQELGLFSKIKEPIIIPNTVSDFFWENHKEIEIAKFRKKYKLLENKRIVLYCGRIDRIKGIENLLDAFMIAKKKVNKISLVIAYPTLLIDQKLLSSIKKIIKLNNLNLEVRLISDIPRSKLPLLYKSASCIVLPSSSEMDSITIREALASGRPVFSTDKGNASNLLGKIDNYFILKNNSVLEISKQLINFFSKKRAWIKKIEKRIYDLKQVIKNSVSVKEYEKLLH